MFEQAFKSIDDVLWKEAGCTTELDYTEQTSWLLFLKYLDGLEQDLADEAAMEGKKYNYILDKPYRWENWAAPKRKDGKLDHNAAMTGDDLRDFVNQKLFPHLHSFKRKASGSNTIEYKIGEIFGEIKNKINSGYNLREIIDHIDELRFRSQTEKYELAFSKTSMTERTARRTRPAWSFSSQTWSRTSLAENTATLHTSRIPSSILRASRWKRTHLRSQVQLRKWVKGKSIARVLEGGTESHRWEADI